MAMEQKQCCATCRREPGCLRKGLMIFSLYIQTGRDQELRRIQHGLDRQLGCPNWEAEET